MIKHQLLSRKIFNNNHFLFQKWITEFLGLGEFLPSNSFIDWIAGFFCDEGILQGKKWVLFFKKRQCSKILSNAYQC